MKCNRRKKSLIVICSLLMINLTACTNEESVVTSDNLQPSSKDVYKRQEWMRGN